MVVPPRTCVFLLGFVVSSEGLWLFSPRVCSGLLWCVLFYSGLYSSPRGCCCLLLGFLFVIIGFVGVPSWFVFVSQWLFLFLLGFVCVSEVVCFFSYVLFCSPSVFGLFSDGFFLFLLWFSFFVHWGVCVFLIGFRLCSSYGLLLCVPQGLFWSSRVRVCLLGFVFS